MSTATQDQPKIAELVVREPLESRASWINRARSADHKVIGTTLIGFSLIALVLGGVTELLTWIQLSVPDNTFLSPERFYRLHTLSDTSYLYLFALPLFAGLATYVLPLQIGARSTAFPRLSALGSWMIVFGGATLYASLFFNTWEAGAQMTAPLLGYFHTPGAGADFWLTAAVLIGGGLTAIAADLAVTYKTMRADGMTGERTPAFAYAANVFSYGILATAPVLVAACLMALIERQWDVFGIFETADGGDALLWKTLFQWWSHAAPYLVTVAAAGVVSEILATQAGGRLGNRNAVKKSLAAFATIGVLGFGQVYFGSSVDAVWQIIFSVIGLAVIVPSAVLVASWIKTLSRGTSNGSTPAFLASVYVVAFTFIAVTTAALSVPTLGAWLDGSQFGWVVWIALVFGSGGIAGVAGVLYWFPKITGRLYSPGPAKLGAALLVAGSVVSLLSVASLGIDGFPREIAEYPTGGGQARYIEAGIATLFAALGAGILLANLVAATTKPANAGNDPWHGGTLEWFAPSPPPPNNFDVIPAVESATPLADLRARIASSTGAFAGSVAQSPTAGRPSLRETKH